MSWDEEERWATTNETDAGQPAGLVVEVEVLLVVGMCLNSL